jgi:hypothetical protein
MRLLGLAGLVLAAGAVALTAARAVAPQEPGQFGFPIEQNLLWLVQDDTQTHRSPETAPRGLNAARPGHELNNLKDIFTALRRCYQPPSIDHARPGMRMTVQFAYTRDGDIFGKPRIVYETQGATPEQQSAYRMAVAAALARCSPLPFSKSLGAAVAGRIFAIQFVDERNLRGAQLTPWPIPTIR